MLSLINWENEVDGSFCPPTLIRKWGSVLLPHCPGFFILPLLDEEGWVPVLKIRYKLVSQLFPKGEREGLGILDHSWLPSVAPAKWRSVWWLETTTWVRTMVLSSTWMCRRSWCIHTGTAITWLPGKGKAGLALGWEVEGWLTSNRVLASFTFIHEDFENLYFGEFENFKKFLVFIWSKLVCRIGSPKVPSLQS